MDSAPEVGWITMTGLATKTGLADARTVRDWCRKRGVPYRRDGRLNWVRIADFEAAMAKLPIANDVDRATAATNAVLSFSSFRGRRRTA